MSVRTGLGIAVLVAGACMPAAHAAAHARAGAANACDNKRVHTFASAIPKTHPATIKAGSKVRLTITVTRGGVVPASAIEVGLTLRGASWFGYGSGVTDGNGVVTTTVAVPKKARGNATLVVDVYHQLVSLPCGNIEEYDYVETPWGKAIR